MLCIFSVNIKTIKSKYVTRLLNALAENIVPTSLLLITDRRATPLDETSMKMINQQPASINFNMVCSLIKGNQEIPNVRLEARRGREASSATTKASKMKVTQTTANFITLLKNIKIKADKANNLTHLPQFPIRIFHGNYRGNHCMLTNLSPDS